MPTATIKKPAKATEKEAEYVSKAAFDDFAGQITGILKDVATTVAGLKTKSATPAEAKEVAEVSKAKHDEYPMPPSWEEKAQEILGEMMDHCEIFMPKGGGTIFTVVIKNEFTNAPQEYMQRHKADRRSREIGNEGIAGVEQWCKLIRANLKRTAAK